MTHTRPDRSADTTPSVPPEAVHDVTRRELLRGAGVASGALVGGVALVACSGGAEEPAGTSPGAVVVPLADVPVGGAVSAQIDGQEVLVTQPVEGEVHAFSAICTHQGCTVTPGDGDLACPCHGSRYALTDAAVLAGPAPEPLPEVTVVVEGDDVVTS
ncbi:Rieske (2Fe-2S) protein [Myceligenerans xiligouense]|uniref:Cytochrome bc1 complex Rieske iron-sulfur subunit n=1 Tax=Myceligenerans xiligouense TaxID=253184 RepID=A0A3N4Z832_9MICO|nr:Rieske (2Fe-2S) protein [Myceligenerans xiligouense]RPF22018.1 nitrite reductase/ring-hydroxylating ferredoxin subunit [Myceligenerans xiligouense]